jgi:hypothetical protein
MKGKAKVAKTSKPRIVQSALASFTIRPPKDHESMSVRKIDNGYVVSHDGYKGGKRFEREYYSPKAPSLAGRTPRKPKGIPP